jgi:hypothetical protein
MRRDPGIAIAIAILTVAAAAAIWLLSDPWLVQGSTSQEASAEFVSARELAGSAR